MQHEDESEHRRATPEEPQRVWQSLYRQEEPGMEMKLTTGQLCAKARYRERENVWFRWIASVACLGFGAAFLYGAVTMDQIWIRLGQAWMALLMAFALWGGIRVGARRMQTGESCAQFMIRELEGSRRTLLSIRWGILLVLPSLLMFWWGSWEATRANALHLDPAIWQHAFVTILRYFVAAILILLAGWIGLGLEAKKRARQAEEMRRTISMQ
jgi:hypothetical protein